MPLVVTGIHDRPPRVGGLNTFIKGGTRLLFYLGPLVAPSRQLNAQESKFSMLPGPNTDRVHGAPRFHFGIFVPLCRNQNPSGSDPQLGVAMPCCTIKECLDSLVYIVIIEVDFD